MDLSALNEMLPGVEDVGGGDSAGSVAPRLAGEADPAAQRVHQPRLAPGLSPYGLQRLRGERLSGLRGVLGEQGVHLGLCEVPDAQRFGPDVERAAAGDDRVLRARMDAVVAHVAHSAQHHALRETPGTPVIAGPQLPEYGDQRVPDQGIDLVDQQHQGSRVGVAPARQRLAEGTAAEGRQDVGPGCIQEFVAQGARP